MANGGFVRLAVEMLERGMKEKDFTGLPKEFSKPPKGVPLKLHLAGIIKPKSRLRQKTTWDKGVHYAPFLKAFKDVSQP